KKSRSTKSQRQGQKRNRRKSRRKNGAGSVGKSPTNRETRPPTAKRLIRQRRSWETQNQVRYPNVLARQNPFRTPLILRSLFYADAPRCSLCPYVSLARARNRWKVAI